MFSYDNSLSFLQLLECQSDFWIRYRRISSQINYRICSQLIIQADLSTSQFEQKLKILNNFIVRNYSDYTHAVSMSLSSSEILKSDLKEKNRVNISKNKSEQSLILTMSNDQSVKRIQQWIATILFNIQLHFDKQANQLKKAASSLQGSKKSNYSGFSGMVNAQQSRLSLSDEEILNQVNENTRKCMYKILNLPVLEEIIEQKAHNIQFEANKSLQRNYLNQVFESLIQTVLYLSKKNRVNLTYSQSLQFLIQWMSYNKNKSIITTEEIKKCNEYIFSPSEFENMRKDIQKNYNFQLISLVKLIDCNYYDYEKQRSIFNYSSENHSRSSSSLNIFQSNSKNNTGFYLQKRIMEYLTKHYSKNQLFSEQHVQIDRMYTLFLMFMEYRYFGVYLDWLALINSAFEEVCNNKHKSIYLCSDFILNKLPKFFSNLPLVHPQYAQFLRTSSSLIMNKYGQNKTITFDIIKKIILNRFLLNPTIFFSFENLGFHKTITKPEVITWFNEIRLLFHENKLKNKLMQSHQNIDQDYQKELIQVTRLNEKIIQTQIIYFHDNLNVLERRQLFFLSKNLYPDYQILSNDFQISRKQIVLFNKNQSKLKFHHREESKSISHNSLSFSFIKNDFSNYNQKNQILNQEDDRKPKKQNQNINYQKQHQPYNQNKILPKGLLNSPNSQKSAYTHKSFQTVHTEVSEEQKRKDQIDMIEQLVKIRRSHGAIRRALDHDIQTRKRNRQESFRYFQYIHQSFEQQRKILEKSLNTILINVEIL